MRFAVCSTIVSSFYASAFTLLGVYGLIATTLLRFAGSITFISRFPRTAIGVWLGGLVLALVAATTSFGMLIAASLSDRSTLGIGESWQAAIAQHALGWVSLAGLGVISFHLIAARQWLQQERLEYARQARAVLGSSSVSQLGTDVREVTLDRHLISAFPQTGTILVSRFSVSTLSPDEVHAALEHERAHLSGRHALVVSVAQLILAATTGVDSAKQFARSISLAVEFAADDHAVVTSDRDALARAIRATSTERDPLAELRLMRLAV